MPGFDKSIKMKKIFDYTSSRSPMDQEEILEKTVVIRLSSDEHISTVKSSLLKDLQVLKFEATRNELTVIASSNEANFEDIVLAIVKTYDPHAELKS